MKITWNTEVNAPCCPGEILAADGRSVLVQTDLDYPGVASSFGWSVRVLQRPDDKGRHPMPDEPGYCNHDGTDGTIGCPECGITAGEFISAARAFLDDSDGATADDPGYFE